MDLDFERCYRAVDSRDPRFDGCFYTAVTTTRIYCRPSCPATTPKRQNVRFYPSSAAAQRAGFRACRRCRPDASPGSPEWDVRADVTGRAVRLIADGVVDREGVPGLAARLGYTERHLHRLLRAELGAGPLALARAQRAQTARILVETTRLGLAEIAFAAGFGSVRQFNDTLREVYGTTPSQLRSRRHAAGIGAGTITLRLPYRPPLHAPALLDFLTRRAVAGVEEVTAGTYRRAVRLPHGPARIALTLAGTGRDRGSGAAGPLRPLPGYVAATLHLNDVRDLAPAVARCRWLLDLDADPLAVDAALATDPALAAAVAAEPGVRVPRAVDGFEMAVRAIVGQQVSVAGARTVLAHLVRAATDRSGPGGAGADAGGPGSARADADTRDRDAGGPGGDLVPFPSPEAVAELPDAAFRMPGARRETIRAVARACAAGDLDLAPGADRAETVARLTALPGIGPWTAGYVAIRAFGDPDTFLHTDLGARRGAETLGLPRDPTGLHRYAQHWRPWRSYALLRLWRAESHPLAGEAPASMEESA
ncbi:AraC family transcriptional regulator [Plantactinospora sp. KBS50]|nr:AlkA N-terminal domain-containing protein [Plantactinospora sp. KBS50]ASW56669.1 AraC family transcriptional regulator [Plantactinospora sp. KBS50]